MIRGAVFLAVMLHAVLAWAQSVQPSLLISIQGEAAPAVSNTLECDVHESPDAPARAIRLADGSVQLYATDQVNQVTSGPDLLHLVQGCTVIFEGAHDDDPAAFDDRSWLATPWTLDGSTIWAVVHDEYHGYLRKELCPTGIYMDCWYNALTLAVSNDAGRTFHRSVQPNTVALVPYRYADVGIGHHGYFNPTNIASWNGLLYFFAFVTKTGVQAEGNCLLRTATIADAASWRAWNGHDFDTRLIDPYREIANPVKHVCQPVAPTSLRWPITSLTRHASTGSFIALMQDSRPGGAIYYSTSLDLLQWSNPKSLLSAIGPGSWTCGDPAPVAYPSLLDPASADRNFETVGDHPVLFLSQFDIHGCRRGQYRHLIRRQIEIAIP